MKEKGLDCKISGYAEFNTFILQKTEAFRKQLYASKDQNEAKPAGSIFRIEIEKDVFKIFLNG